MRVVVVRDAEDGERQVGADMFAYALSTDPLQRVVLNGARRLSYTDQGQRVISKLLGHAASRGPVWVVPPSWRGRLDIHLEETVECGATGVLDPQLSKRAHQGPWSAISDGRFAAHINGSLLERVLQTSGADALAVAVAPDLLAYRERVRVTQQGELVGYRRRYRDAAEPMPVSEGWPHHFFIKSVYVEAVLADGLPEDFSEVVERCRKRGLSVQAVAMAGFVVNLGSPRGLLRLSEVMLKDPRTLHAGRNVKLGRQVSSAGGDEDVSSDARFVGPVLLGSDVRVEPGAVIVGPSILCDGSTVQRDAVVDSSILGAKVVVKKEKILRSAFVVADDSDSSTVTSSHVCRPEDEPEMMYSPDPNVFRSWPLFSYARCLKRVVDIIVALVVLLLFIPVIPVMALAIKISSPGPVFFRDKRQGLHGQLFNCIKFRTMRVGAADIQDKLRFVSDVDGPQFKMTDDPRISTVGRFLRETYLDEIPQFFNVLCGQMSVVGPRPSPESENTLCPSWRDARLSVRPGITGLWQVYRTRRPFKDFQEWIYYDTQYVRQLSPRMDLWICWCTFKKMVGNFAAQF
ncbi:MAG: sugar transferase [Phycisphaerales bacterium]|nr:MAG: sugar transferase [Phycisphaerales bacterium]